MELTKRQALFLITICLVVNKVQRLPSFISAKLGRHGWLVFLMVGVVEIISLTLALFFIKKSKNRTTYQICEKAGGKIFAKGVYILFGIYFLLNSLLPYEAVHDLFANILFDFLSWETYSLVFAITIFFIANKRLRDVGRVGEIFYYAIVISFIILLSLGATTTNYQRILPLADINFVKIVDTCITYSLWFGDFLIVYAIVGRVKDGENLGGKLTIAYGICIIILSFSYIIFYGLYEHLSPNQNSLISSISQFSLLNLEIGRIDWFFVLFFQIGTVIASGLYLHLASESFRQVIGIKSKKYVALVLVALIYLADIFVFKSIQEGVSVIASITKYFAVTMIAIIPIILLIAVVVANKKDEKKAKKNGVEKYSRLGRKVHKEPLIHKELVVRGQNK